ncbi:PIN domain-containing protein [Flavobacterium sp.]|uniref:PIN domain-containing protein n=1 Tax=Flavobacterium sp. TaxID=239 RepID=UPI003D6B0F4A
MSKDTKNHFIYNRHFPDSKSILQRKGKGVTDILKNAIFVLDTNSLLIPFNTGKENIEEIGKIYQNLISSNKLYIPEHSLKEFAKNRSFRISELFSTIDNQLSTLPPIKSFDYPILEGLDAYKKLKKTKEEVLKQIKEYKKDLEDLKSGIIDWNWSDPVTTMYQNTFTEKIIISPAGSEEELIKEYENRIEDDIPPGNKDKSKDNNAIGDFLIWKSILELGKKKKKDIIFVSNDEKNDWLLKGNQKSISTKFELVDEYYRFTGGYDFMSMNFKTFLDFQGLEINIFEVFKEFEDIFELPNSLKKPSGNNTFKALKEIDKYINTYLIDIEDEYDDVYIDQNINEQIDIFDKNYRVEYFGTEDWNIYFDYFFLFSKMFDQMKFLNNEIVYQAHRQKRSTYAESIQLTALCKEFSNKYASLELMR